MPDIEQTRRALETGSVFLQAVALEFDTLSGTSITATIALGPEHHTPWGVVHGGVYATIAESAASVGASLAVEDDGKFAVGVHNATDFLRSMTAGTLRVEARPLQQGRVQQLWLVTMTREDGKDVARAQVRLQNIPLPAAT